MIAFKAKGVAATRLLDLNTHIVVLAEDPDGDGTRLQISRSMTISEQDRELGLDTYCLSTQTGATAYGGVSSYSLDDSTLTMRLESYAADTLGVPGEFTIVLETDAATVESVRVALMSILGGKGEVG